MLVFGFARAAQFSITAGNTSALRPADIAAIQQRAVDIAKLTQAVRQVVSSAFRLGSGEVLLLGIPVAEPERATDRRGLCVAIAVFVSRRRVSSAAMLVQMLASLELAIAETCHGSYTNPSVTATVYTQLLQRRNDDSALNSVSSVTKQLSLLYSSMLKVEARRRRRKFQFFHSMYPKGSTLNNVLSVPHYAVSFQAATRLKASRTGALCYYLPFGPEMVVARIAARAIETHLFLDSGIIIGHSFPRDFDSYFQNTFRI